MSHKSIAKEIVSIEFAFGRDVLRVQNTNDARAFAAEVESFVDRLNTISKELDKLGPFPADLREVTMKELDNKERFDTLLSQNGSAPRLPIPEVAKIVERAGDMFFPAWSSVMAKAGLEEKVKQPSPATNAIGQATNKPRPAP